MGILLVNPRS